MHPASDLVHAVLEHRARRAVVIIVTFAIGLLTLWPAVDDVIVARRQRQQLLVELTDAQQQAAELATLRQQAADRAATLRQVGASAVAQKEVHAFRNHLVELARGNGCRVRRIDLGESRVRPWHDTDSPLLTPTKENGEPTRYQLTSQGVTFTAAGPIEAVRRLLARLHEEQTLLHTRRFTLRRDGRDGKDVVLELELRLFDLVRANTVSA